MLRRGLVGVTATVIALAGSAQAQGDFPNRPMRLVNPYSPGGSVDVVSRALASAITEMWNMQVIVDNRPGAGTTIGTEIVSHAQPDGYTMLVNSSAIAIMPSMYSRLTFSTIDDLTPVNLLTSSCQVLVVHPSVPAKTVNELIALAKAEPGKITGASSGVGSTNHLTLEMFKSMTGADIVHVPYKGGGPALVDVVAGQVKIFFNAASTILPHIKAGRVRGIAVTSAKRQEQFPDLPTVDEAGVPGFESVSWYGLYGPKNLPKHLVQRWNEASTRYLHDPKTVEFFRRYTMTTGGVSPAEFAAYHRNETERWGKVMKTAGVKPL
jgi:tripartite-type tricarboxylate transporter receptor subunit TctC